MSAPTLAERLAAIAAEYKQLQLAVRDNRRRAGEALLEVSLRDPDLNLAAAAVILGISRPTAYSLMDDAGGREAGR